MLLIFCDFFFAAHPGNVACRLEEKVEHLRLDHGQKRKKQHIRT